jgi:hypothetical protein
MLSPQRFVGGAVCADSRFVRDRGGRAASRASEPPQRPDCQRHDERLQVSGTKDHLALGSSSRHLRKLSLLEASWDFRTLVLSYLYDYGLGVDWNKAERMLQSNLEGPAEKKHPQAAGLLGSLWRLRGRNWRCAPAYMRKALVFFEQAPSGDLWAQFWRASVLFEQPGSDPEALRLLKQVLPRVIAAAGNPPQLITDKVGQSAEGNGDALAIFSLSKLLHGLGRQGLFPEVQLHHWDESRCKRKLHVGHAHAFADSDLRNKRRWPGWLDPRWNRLECRAGFFDGHPCCC